VLIHNASLLFWVLQLPLGRTRVPEGQRADYAGTLAAIDAAMAPLGAARMQRPDAALIVEEFENTARLMRHACRRGEWLLEREHGDTAATRRALDADLRDVIREYERIWLLRNRPGGLADSAGRLQKARADYGIA
jgi:hypothetical protein